MDNNQFDYFMEFIGDGDHRIAFDVRTVQSARDLGDFGDDDGRWRISVMGPPGGVVVLRGTTAWEFIKGCREHVEWANRKWAKNNG